MKWPIQRRDESKIPHSNSNSLGCRVRHKTKIGIERESVKFLICYQKGKKKESRFVFNFIFSKYCFDGESVAGIGQSPPYCADGVLHGGDGGVAVGIVAAASGGGG